MNWMLIIERITKKSPVIVIISIVVLFVLLLAKWQFQFPFDALWFFLGGALGIYLLDVFEVLFDSKPSPFRSILFSVLLFVLTFYLVVSTREFTAQGLSLMLLLNLCYLYLMQWKEKQDVGNWFTMFFGLVSKQGEKMSVILFIVGTIFLHLLFLGS